jgi:hypothetical protein
MPYKAVGTRVLVHRDGRWRVLKVHDTAEQARKHAAALNINVHRKGK